MRVSLSLLALAVAAVSADVQASGPCEVYPTQTYRLVYQTVYDVRQVTAYRLEQHTVCEPVQITSYRTVWETEMRERRYRV